MSRKVIIIGAGAAGLSCAQQLVKGGLKVSIYDKSRGIGGRIATRRIKNGIFNHGASRIPDFTNCNALPKDLKKLLKIAVEQKILIPQGNNFTSFGSMKTFTSYLSRGVNVHKNSEVISVKRTDHSLELLFKNATKIPIKNAILIFAIPQPQLLNLLKIDFPNIFSRVQPAKMHASISGLFAFHKSLSLNTSFIENNYISGFRENSRIGQNIELDCWTIHSKQDFGKKSSHLSKAEIKEILLKEFKKLVPGNLPRPIYAEGHRWLHGFTDRALNKNYIFSHRDQIGICGDWCRGKSVMDALISGTILADKILTSVVE